MARRTLTGRTTVGAVEVLALVDAMPGPREPDQFFPGISASAWAPYRAHLDAAGKVRVQFGFFALRSQGRTIVVDTGLGPGPHERLGGLRGQALAELASRGIRPTEVDAVVITHLHGDHVGWNITWEAGPGAAADGPRTPRLTFPRARYYIPQGDWDHFTRPEALAGAPHVTQNVLPLQSLGALELVKDGSAVTSEVSMLDTPGHTPGHQCVLISSQGHQGIIVGDLFHNQAQVSEPGWNVGADMDQEMARRTRRAVLDRLEREGFIVAVGHIPVGDNVGRLVRLEGRRVWRAL